MKLYFKKNEVFMHTILNHIIMHVSYYFTCFQSVFLLKHRTPNLKPDSCNRQNKNIKPRKLRIGCFSATRVEKVFVSNDMVGE